MKLYTRKIDCRRTEFNDSPIDRDCAQFHCAGLEQGNKAGVLRGMRMVVQIVVQFRSKLQGDCAEKLQGQQSAQHPEPGWGSDGWS